MLTAKRPQCAAWSTLVAVLVATGCGDPSERPGASTSDTARAALRIVAVTHGVSANPFWSVVINGLDDAARDLGVRVEYQAPSTFDMVAMSEIIDAVVASRPVAARECFRASREYVSNSSCDVDFSAL